MKKRKSESNSSSSSSGTDSESSSSEGEQAADGEYTGATSNGLQSKMLTEGKPTKSKKNDDDSSSNTTSSTSDSSDDEDGSSTSSTSSGSSSQSSDSEDEDNHPKKEIEPEKRVGKSPEKHEEPTNSVENYEKEQLKEPVTTNLKEPVTTSLKDPVTTGLKDLHEVEVEKEDKAVEVSTPQLQCEAISTNKRPAVTAIDTKELPEQMRDTSGDYEPENKKKKVESANKQSPPKIDSTQNVATKIAKEQRHSPERYSKRRRSREVNDRHRHRRSRSRSKHRHRNRTRSRSRSRKRSHSAERSQRNDRFPEKSAYQQEEDVDAKERMTARQRRTVDLLTSRTGGAYIPPAKLRLLQAEITDKSSAAYQRIAWEALKKSIHGYINKINVDNIGIITRELLKENIVRGRGLLCRSIIQAQSASPTFTHVYAALVAIINSKFPNIGELLLKRLVIQFKRSFRRNDKPTCLSASRFIAHLVNQRVAHEILALEILTLLVETPTDDSVEVAIAFLKECGMKLTEVSTKGIGAIFEMLKNILHEGKLDKRVQYMIEVVFQVRKDGFKDHQSVIEALELVDEDDQFTHLLMLDDVTATEDQLNAFKFDEKYETNEDKYKGLSKEILGSDVSDSGSDDTDGDNDDSDSDNEEEEPSKGDAIIDSTETNLVALRRTIYLTINSSLDYEECAHKLMKMQLKPGQEIELCHMFLDCCAEQRTYEKFYGLLAQRFCSINKTYIEPFEEIFKDTYQTTHRLDTNRLRNVSKFFAHLLFTDAIGWDVLECVKLNEDDTTSSSRIFIKILFQELAEYMGLTKLNEKLKDEAIADSLTGLLPKDNPRNTRFAINFFTSIGLGGLTDDLRQFLKSAPKNVPAINSELLPPVQEISSNSASPSSASSSSSSTSVASSSSSSSSSTETSSVSEDSSTDCSTSEDGDDGNNDSISKKKKQTSKRKKTNRKEPIKKKSRKKRQTSSSEATTSDSDSKSSSSDSSIATSSTSTDSSSEEEKRLKKSKNKKRDRPNKLKPKSNLHGQDKKSVDKKELEKRVINGRSQNEKCRGRPREVNRGDKGKRSEDQHRHANSTKSSHRDREKTRYRRTEKVNSRY